MPRSIPILLVWIFLSASVIAQNTGIGTNSPQAKLHVNGDLRLQNGDAVNAFSRDSLFSSNSHLKVPTEKAVKDFIQKGNWLAPSFTTAGNNAPAFLGPNELPISIYGGSVACTASFAYVASFNSDIFYVFDITDPNKVNRRGFIPTSFGGPSLMALAGNLLYLSYVESNKLVIIDVSNPDNPIIKGTATLGLTSVTDIEIKGNYAYIGDMGTNKIYIYDISNPLAVLLKSSGGVGQSGKISLDIQANFLYVTSSSSDVIQIYDISNPISLVFSSGATGSLVEPRDVTVKGNKAFVASYGNNSISVFDISNPVSPTFLSSIPNIETPEMLRVMGNYLIAITSFKARVSVLEIGTTGALKLIGSNNGTISSASSLAINENLICVSNLSTGFPLCLFDLDVSRSLAITGNGVSPVSDLWKPIGKNIYRNAGLVGIGTSVPSYELEVIGRIRGSEEIKTNLLSASTATIGSVSATGGVFNFSSFNSINTTNATINSQLTFSNSLTGKIILYGGGAASQYGVGVKSGLLQLYTDASFADIAFGYGSSDAFIENMRIKGNGNVGIGINNPSNPLSFPAIGGKKISFYPGASGDIGMSVGSNDFRIYADNPNARVSFGYDSYVSGFISRAYIPASGTVALVAQGNINANGIVYNSDIRYKKKIATINNSLDKVLKLRGVVYEMRTDEFPTYSFNKGQQMGLIAQEVESIVPEVVSTNEDGYKSVDYAKLVPLLIESIKAQQKEIEELKRLIKVK